MDEIKALLLELKSELQRVDEKIVEMQSQIEDVSSELAELSEKVSANEATDNRDALEDLSAHVDELQLAIEGMQGPGPDDTFTDVCNKLSVLIRWAGYEDTTLHLGSKLLDGNGRELIVTKYDITGMEVEYADQIEKKE